MIGYWLFYVELGRAFDKGEPALAMTKSLSGVELPGGGVLRMPLPPNQTNFTVPKAVAGTVLSQVELPNAEKLIALTFDNGPDPEITPQILDILQQYNVQATFFMSGVNVDQQPDLARRIVAEGHAVGNRGWNLLSEADQNIDAEHEVEDTAKLIEETTGAKTTLFRPSTGQNSSPLTAYAKGQNNAVILWSIDSQDSLVAAPILLDNVLRNAQPGRIVLLHDGPGNGMVSSTVQALPQLIAALQHQGYRFVTVPSLVQHQQPKPEASPEAKDLKNPAEPPDPKDSKDPELTPASDRQPEPKPKPDLLNEPPSQQPDKQQPDKASDPERKVHLRKPAVALLPE